ncbi:MAG: hypothetical protein AB8B83_04130 [Bdellovibrionales bacterium]
MKKLIATIAIVGSAATLSACETSGVGNVDTAPPYADERTATHSTNATPAPAPAPVRAERVFREEMTK